MPIEDGKLWYRDGRIIGVLSSSIAVIAFAVYFRNLHSSALATLLVGAPIALMVGAMIGLAVDGSPMPHMKRITLELTVLVIFTLYSIGLIFFLASRI